MADGITQSTAKLQLDEETGEMVSKGELRKRMQKRAKKAAAASAARASTASTSTGAGAGEEQPSRKQQAKADSSQLDPDAMFKQGFLAEVFRLRPSEQVLTRFPPEPNGFLHLGHAKAIAVNFGFAKYHGGKTQRFDDTNPDKEKEEYFLAIEETIRWLGFEPCAITYSSDNFQKLYDYAEALIRLSKAYVCHCQEADIKLQRGGQDGKEGPRYRCAHADQDVDTNLHKFRDMRDGKYAPQTAFLRMKQDIESGNPQMWDLAAYRIPKDRLPHYRTKDEWCIYPTYDFAHCLCDSIEGITHSLCTTEFVLSRESYEWLNKSLGVYEPMQREYGKHFNPIRTTSSTAFVSGSNLQGRLNINGTIMSKRGLHRLVEEQVVRGWDDPRLYTLSALRRRGVPPGAILAFINELGVTTANTVIQIPRFEQTVRRYLETTVPRLMLVLDPVPLVIDNLDELEAQEVDLPFSPKDPTMGIHKLPITRTVYIDQSDFREVDSPDYFRLALGKTVGLLQIPYPVKATTFSKDATTGRVTEIRARLDKESKKPKTHIQWVPEGSRQVEVRLHSPLFKSDDPAAVEGGFMNDIDTDSETVYPLALVEAGFETVRKRAPWPAAAGEKAEESLGPEGVRFQGMRVAYFAVDSESTADRVILNRIVSLKEDTTKKKVNQVA